MRLAGQSLLECYPETFEPPKRYSVPDTSHRVKVKVQVMQRVKGCRGDFAGLFGAAPMHYRSKWYVIRGAEPLIFALGIFGQYLFVDPAREAVLVKMSSEVAPLDPNAIDCTMRGVEAILGAL